MMNKLSEKPEPILVNHSPEKYFVLISISFVLVISILNLIGWLFGITILKSITDHWVPMMMDTAVSFILCALSLYIIQKRITTGLLSLIPKISGVLVFVIGAISTYLQIAILNNVDEKTIIGHPFLGIFLAPGNRMALITACNFMLIGIILFLISYHKKKLTGIAHAIIFPSLLISFTIPVSYILGVTNLHDSTFFSVALPTAIAFCFLCAGILFNDPDSWLMKVFTSHSSGGLMARRLLPGIILLPLVIGWLRILGEKKDFFESEVGVVLTTITYTVCFIFLTWLSAKAANKIDHKRKQAEDLQRETNEYLENLFSYANAPIIVWDTTFIITRFNPAFELLTGRKADDVIGHSIEILFPVELVENSMELIKKAQTGERLEIAEIKILHVDGSIKTVLWNSAPVLGADRKTIIEIIAQGQDITHRKLAEDSLRETNEYLENLFSYANAPIIVWDTTFKITRFNPAFELLTGRKAEEVIGHSIEILFPDELVESSMDQIKKAQTGERLEIAEINILHDNSSIKTVLWNSAPVLGADGKTIIEIIAQGQDITERKQAEDELDTYRKHLEELVTERTSDLAKAINNLERSNKELEEFAYVASHDLQEPLRMVSSYTQLLERRYKDKLDQDANDFIQYAVDGASRMQRLINDLLEYSRVSSQGKNFSKVDMSQVLGQAVSNLQNLIFDNHALVTNEDLPELTIDETQIVRVFQNLIENAIKYKKKTELPKIHIACKKKNNLYEFSVSDNGLGIEMQYHDRIFIIFQRLHRKDEYPGTGIGLSVSKRIIERHGGKIWFESKEGEGTTFFFTIPA